MSAGGAHRPLELRALAGLELQAQIHRVRNREDVREQDRGIERIAIDRLQRDFAGDLGIGAHLEETAGARARGAILRQIAAGLAHQPDRPARRGLAQQGAQQQVVLQRFARCRASGSLARFEQAADVREWRSDRSCRRCSRPRRARVPPGPAPVPVARARLVFVRHQGGIVEKCVEQIAHDAARLGGHAPHLVVLVQRVRAGRSSAHGSARGWRR